MSEPRDFDRAMRHLYDEAKDAGYNATYFLGMLNEIGGVATARKLVMSPQPAEGFTRLWEMGRLDLSVEALVLESDWRPLFTAEERQAARRRLEDYRYSPPG